MPAILIADDHPLFRDALRRAVERIRPGARVREAESVPDLLGALEDEPDAELLLLDLNMPGAHGFSALVHLRGQHPALPVLVVSAQDDAALMRRALAHGASGFVPKSSGVERLAEAIAAVAAGDTWLPEPQPAGPLDAEEEALAARVAELTPAQFRVLGMVCTGLLNKQIAWELGVSEATVKAHMTAVLRKLGAHSRTQAVLLAGKLMLDGARPEALAGAAAEDAGDA